MNKQHSIIINNPLYTHTHTHAQVISLFHQMEASLYISVAYARALKFTFYILSATHFSACIWFPLACYSEGRSVVSCLSISLLPLPLSSCFPKEKNLPLPSLPPAFSFPLFLSSFNTLFNFLYTSLLSSCLSSHNNHSSPSLPPSLPPSVAPPPAGPPLMTSPIAPPRPSTITSSQSIGPRQPSPQSATETSVPTIPGRWSLLSLFSWWVSCCMGTAWV